MDTTSNSYLEVSLKACVNFWKMQDEQEGYVDKPVYVKKPGN